MTMTREHEDYLAHDEWMAWRVVCDLLLKAGIDVNNDESMPLVRAMRHHARAYRELFHDDVRHVEADRDATETRALYDMLGRRR